MTLIDLSPLLTGFPHSSVNKASVCKMGDLGSIPGSGSYPGEGNGNPFQYPCLENLMDRGAWWTTGHGVARVSEISYNFPFPWDKTPEDCFPQLPGEKNT